MLESTSVGLYRYCYSCEKCEVPEREKLESLTGVDGEWLETVNRVHHCGRCHVATYCSKECQQKDWPTHKKCCFSPDISLESDRLHQTVIYYFQKVNRNLSLKTSSEAAEIGYGVLIVSTPIGSGNHPEVVNDRYVAFEDQFYIALKSCLPNEKLEDLSEVGKKHYAQLVSLCQVSKTFIVRVLKVNLDLSTDLPFQSVGNLKYKVAERRDCAPIAEVRPKEARKSEPILVYQRQWAFTTAGSEQPTIKTSSASVCFVVSLTYGTHAALAHIDCDTDVGSLNQIFLRFQDKKIPIQEIQVVVIGGWKNFEASKAQGDRIKSFLKSLSIREVNDKHMYSKQSHDPSEDPNGFSKEEFGKHYHENVVVNAETGKTYFTGNNRAIHREQRSRNAEFEKQLTAEFGEWFIPKKSLEEVRGN